MTYGALALLCHAVPEFFVKSLRLFNLFLQKLSMEEGVNSKQCVKDALKTIRSAYAKSSPEVLQNLNEALRLKLEDPDIDHDQAYVCLEWLVCTTLTIRLSFDYKKTKRYLVLKLLNIHITLQRSCPKRFSCGVKMFENMTCEFLNVSITRLS